MRNDTVKNKQIILTNYDCICGGIKDTLWKYDFKT